MIRPFNLYSFVKVAIFLNRGWIHGAKERESEAQPDELRKYIC
jgi:hypothetical protein